jgi:hypothetical protein
VTINVYLNAYSDLTARPNHLICHLGSCPVSPATFCVKFSSLLLLHCVCVCVRERERGGGVKNQQENHMSLF